MTKAMLSPRNARFVSQFPCSNLVRNRERLNQTCESVIHALALNLTQCWSGSRRLPLGKLAANGSPPKAALAALSGLCVVSALSISPARAEPSSANPEYSEAELFSEVLTTIRQHYDGPVDGTALTTAALKAMLAALDGHSAYMTPEEYRQFEMSAKGQFAGIGAVVGWVEVNGRPRLQVMAPTAGGPSARAGVAAGWEIQSVNGTTLQNLSLQKAIDMLRGDEGSTASVVFIDDRGAVRSIDLKREIIRIPGLHHRRIGDVGYIHLTGFSQAGNQEFADAVSAMVADGPLSGLILDVRNNTGGFIDTAIAIARRFLKPGMVVVRVGSDAASSRPISVETEDSLGLQDIPVVVLVNSASASASEILTAALQDNHRASVVGLVTFGKGLVQTIYPLKGGKSGAVSVTTMRYYTPSGRSIQRTGLVPDLLVARTVAEARSAVSSRPVLSEADIVGAPPNEMDLARFNPTHVEGPSPGEDTPPDMADPPLFRDTLPSDQDILDDFQIQRALDVIRAGSVAAAVRLRPATIYGAAPVTSDNMAKGLRP